MQLKCLVGALAIAVVPALATSTAAQTSIQLGSYVVTADVPIPILGGLGLEASAVTYARDRGTLFIVGDEGGGVVELTRGGSFVSSMTFSGWPTASTNNDAEGLAYLGGGVLVVAEERLQDAFRFTYVASGSVDLAGAAFVSFGANTGNTGTEGISVDPRSGRFVTVKQSGPQQVLEGTLAFGAPPAGGTSALAPLFDPALLGLASLSDVQTLSPVDAFGGTPAADNLLILSLDSQRLVEVTRSGSILSFLDLASLTGQAIEGVTVDENGTVYLVAEGAGSVPSRLLVLSPIPEPETWLLLASGLTAIGFVGRRRGRARSAA